MGDTTPPGNACTSVLTGTAEVAGAAAGGAADCAGGGSAEAFEAVEVEAALTEAPPQQRSPALRVA